MVGSCPNPFCYVDDGGGCSAGNPDPYTECETLKGAIASAATSSEPKSLNTGQGQVVFPWSGNALGAVDLPFAAARSHPHIVGLIGPHNAGKTTLLAALYLQLGGGAQLDTKREFAGSYTLGGWEAVANALRWSTDHPPSFPAHTPIGPRRAPGMLHLAFRDEAEQLKDTFFADAPGEWFDRWAHQRDAKEAESARWLAERAGVFLLVADCAALSGPDRGNARKIMRLLAERLAEVREDRPVALVWTKADLTPPADIVAAVQSAVQLVIPDIREFDVTVAPKGKLKAGFMALLDWVLSAQRSPGLAAPIEAPKTKDPFLAYMS